MTRLWSRTLALFVLCVLLVGPGSHSLTGQSAPPHTAATPSQICDIHGTVVDITPDTSEESFARLTAAETEADLGRVFTEMFARRPAPNVVVMLRGASVPMEAVTDAEGRFEFTGLPRGEYEISAETPSWPSRTGQRRMATAKTVFNLDTHNGYVRLELRADRITVSGRIRDEQGQPVSGAKVVGIQEVNSESGEVFPNVVTTLSDVDGFYELQGLNPPSVYNTAGYLAGGDGTGELGLASFYLLVRVDAEGYTQSRQNVPRFPLVSENLLASARRLLQAFNRMQTRREGSSEIREKEGLAPFPASQGNTITGVDIVLDRRPALAHVSGRVLDTKGKPGQDRMLDFAAIRSAPPLPGSEYVESREPRGIRTDGAGCFEIPAMAPGKYAIIVYGSNGYGSYQVPVRGSVLEVKPGEHVDDFEILVNPPEDFAVSGHVWDAKGNPVPGLLVSTRKSHGFPWYAETNGEGAYRIVGLDGTGEISFKISFGYDGLAIPDVPLNATNVDVVVPGKGSIDGVVRDAKTGEAIASYEVKVLIVLLPNSRAIWTEPRVEIEKQPDGGFRIENVPAGEATVEVRAEEAGTQPFTIRVDAGKTSSLECEMRGPAAPEGRTPADGEPKGDVQAH